MILGFATILSRYRMGVVEADQSLAIRPVQSERVVQSVWLLLRHGHRCHDEPNPVATIRVHHENLPVEVQKHIKGRVARLRHGVMLSD